MTLTAWLILTAIFKNKYILCGLKILKKKTLFKNPRFVFKQKEDGEIFSVPFPTTILLLTEISNI